MEQVEEHPQIKIWKRELSLVEKSTYTPKHEHTHCKCCGKPLDNAESIIKRKKREFNDRKAASIKWYKTAIAQAIKYWES